MSDVPPEIATRIAAASMHDGLTLLVLFGSRARGQGRPGSDWDFAYLAEPGFDADVLLVDLVSAVQSERVDLADLRRAGAVLRFCVARDGVVVRESQPRLFERFQIEASRFWCDTEPVLRAAYDRVLRDLHP